MIAEAFQVLLSPQGVEKTGWQWRAGVLFGGS
jgi:hypothetical protein